MTSGVAAGERFVVERATRRISLQIAAVVTVVVLSLVAVVFLVVSRGQRQADDRLLDRTIAGADDVRDPPAGVWLVMRQGTRQVATHGMPDVLPDQRVIDQVAADGTTRTTDLSAGGRDYLVRTRSSADGDVVQALLDLSADHAERARLVEACVICGVAGLVLSGVVGVVLGRRAVAPLTEALALRRRFVADAGHELRTPLTLLSTRAQLVSRSLGADVDAGSVRSDVDGLVADARHLSDILDDLLVAADPRDESTDEPVPLPELVGQVVASVCPLAEERGVEVSWTSTGNQPSVMGNRASLRRAVTALLDNAVRHATSTARVTITRDGKVVVVDVADDGPGVADDVRTTLFDRFTSSSSDVTSGHRRRYGLGLALVSEVADHHGGAVSVVHTDRAGATLRLRLPAAPAATPGGGAPSS